MKHEPQRWKADYERDGYVVVPDCVDAELLGRLRAAADRITSNYNRLPPSLRVHIQLEQDFLKFQPQTNDLPPERIGDAIKLIMELPMFDPIFADLICHEPLLDVLETLFGTSEFAFHNYKAIIKAPRVSSAFVWHRDLPYLQHTSPNLLTAMICLDEMSQANGATVVYPGTHRIPHESVPPSDMHIPEAKLPRDIEPVTVKCPAGSAVLFHVNIIHGGGPNRSEIPRRNIISIWTGPHTYSGIAHRFAYQGVMPRSKDPERRKQLRMAFPRLFKDEQGQPLPRAVNSREEAGVPAPGRT
ncbi:phytanoyl-CoA dioxygenase family protein [Fontivita pretiosa]|uniref:phytanoyl-CoA dioxygenase family protein n=1 Tax=Fontivita pretiosa TaxID=2989684 RepID=UPI003D17D6E4